MYRLLGILLGLFLSISSNAERHDTIYDMKNFSNTYPRNFRFLESMLDGKKIHISASGQFTVNQVNYLKHIAKLHNKKLLVIDLRAEKHGFVNGLPVHFLSDDNISEEIIQHHKLHKITVKDSHHYVDIKVKDFLTEAELLEKHNVKYYNIKIRNMFIPEYDQINILLDLIRSYKDDYWIHIHCKAGKGRTTTALVAHFISEYSNTASLEEILDYHHKIGGINITIDSAMKKDFIYRELALERAEFIRKLYEVYTNAN